MRLARYGALALLIAGIALLVYWGTRPTRTWEAPLRRALSGADRLVLDLSVTGRGQPRVVFEVNGVAKIRELVGLIEIDPTTSAGYCECHGDVLFRFYRGTTPLAIISSHHGKGLRWRDGLWPGDAELTEAARASIPAWFKANGYAMLQQRRDADLAEAAEQAAEESRFASFFPEHVRKLLIDGHPPTDGLDLKSDEAEGAELADLMHDPVGLTVAACRALAVSRYYRAGTSNKERRVLAAMKTVGSARFFAGLQQLADDQVGLLGAAQLFFSEGFADKVPADSLHEWAVRLARAVILHAPGRLRWRGVDDLIKYDCVPARELLFKVARGQERPEDWAENDLALEELRATAYLGLSRFGAISAREEISQFLAQAQSEWSHRALQVGLALLGDPAELNEEHFRAKSYMINSAAVAAVERFAGAFGMDLLVGAILSEGSGVSQYQAIRAFERVTGVTIIEPESYFDAEKHPERVRTWWVESGAAFVQQRRTGREHTGP